MTKHGELERAEPQAEAERGRPGGRTIAGVISRAAAAERILHAMELLPDARRRGVEPKRVSDELGFVLHARPWSETSLLVDAVTARFGRIFLIARGAQRPSSQMRGLLTPFHPLRLSWFGRNEAKVLARAEWMGDLTPPAGEALLSGFYVNELLLRLTVREDPIEGLLPAYVMVLAGLSAEASADRQRALRRFEAELLRLSGWWPPATTGAPDPAGWVVRDGTLVGLAHASPEGVEPVYATEDVEALLRLDFSSVRPLRAARDILREMINRHLGSKPLRSRRVLAELNRL